jgi:ABC-type lipoprotein release transport system permease subunit
VRAGDPGVLMLPAVTIVGVAFISAIPAVVRAVQVDPAETLRAE